MKVSTRKLLDKSFTSSAYCVLGLVCLTILLFLAPIVYNGLQAVLFSATVEHDKFLHEVLNKETSASFTAELKKCADARKPLYAMMREFENPSAGAFSEAEKSLEALRMQWKDGVKNSAARIEDILKNEDAQAREIGIKKFADEIQGAYLAKIKSIEGDEKLGDYNALRLMAAEAEKVSEAAREAVNLLAKESHLGFSQKNALRRALCADTLAITEKALEEIGARTRNYEILKEGVRELLGPENAKERQKESLMRNKYGQTRTQLARDVLKEKIETISIHVKNKDGSLVQKSVSSAEYFKGKKPAEMVSYIRNNFDAMLNPHTTVYLGFFFDDPIDANIFGGMWPTILGTIYLTLGSMLIATPLGVIAAIYFTEYAKEGAVVSVLRMCVGTLAGVPSIVFGLFGLTFIINTLKVSEGKSVLAGSITLALLVLPTIIRACEEALKSVPYSYKEAALGLGAGKWKSITSVILPAATPGMLTGVIISMGRAAGETAPIIFTAATSTGAALAIWEIFTQPTPALPWNIYNMASEHEMAERVLHVQYGMVLTLLAIVFTLNFAAIMLRARLQKKLKA